MKTETLNINMQKLNFATYRQPYLIYYKVFYYRYDYPYQ